MKTIEQILSRGSPFKIDSIVCMQHAAILKAYVRPDEDMAWSHHPAPIKLVFKVAFVAICHQFNWDFLQGVLARQLLQEGDNLPRALSEISSRTIAEWLCDYPKKDRIRAEERARLLRDVGRVISDKYASIEEFYNACAGASLKHGEFHHIMNSFAAYSSDILQKKTNVLTHDLIREKIIQFKDEGHIKPAVDYHIMRVYLRTGRVVPSDHAVYRFLKGTPNPRLALVKHLRRTVGEAVELTALYSGLNVADVNFIEWQIGRGICHNKAPLCLSQIEDSNVDQSVRKLSNQTCPYMDICVAKNLNDEFLDFEEPSHISVDY